MVELEAVTCSTTETAALESDDGFRLECACSIWIGAQADAGRVCRRCRYPLCVPHYGRRRAGLECERCLELAKARHEGGPSAPEHCDVRAQSQVSTSKRRRRNYRRRPVEFVSGGESLRGILESLGPEVERVFLSRSPASPLEFASSRLPEGWAADDRGHYLGGALVLRYRRPDGRRLEVLEAAGWFGDDGHEPETMAAAWESLEVAVAGRFQGGSLLTTPASTGRALFERTIPHGREWPVLSLELQELIRSTAGQGRIELIRHDGELPELLELDGRIMYGALCWGLPAGVPVLEAGGEYAGMTRGRYEITATVPAGWEHVGLLGVHDGDGWRYPSTPGETFTTWADGVEVGLALSHGWPLKIRQRLLFPTYRGKGPLDLWAERLVSIAQSTTHESLEVGELVRRGARAILLHAIGAFTGRPTRTTHSGDAGAVPADAHNWRLEGDVHLWESGEAQAWAEMAHPEWAAAIWARARARLLDAPTGARGVRAGALHLEPGAVVAFRTDAIYTTAEPAWPDDGKAGRFRLKWRSGRPVPAPQSHLELLTMKGQTT